MILKLKTFTVGCISSYEISGRMTKNVGKRERITVSSSISCLRFDQSV